MNRRVWRATVHGITNSWSRLSMNKIISLTMKKKRILVFPQTVITVSVLFCFVSVLLFTFFFFFGGERINDMAYKKPSSVKIKVDSIIIHIGNLSLTKILK